MDPVFLPTGRDSPHALRFYQEDRNPTGPSWRWSGIMDDMKTIEDQIRKVMEDHGVQPSPALVEEIASIARNYHDDVEVRYHTIPEGVDLPPERIRGAAESKLALDLIRQGKTIVGRPEIRFQHGDQRAPQRPVRIEMRAKVRTVR